MAEKSFIAFEISRSMYYAEKLRKFQRTENNFLCDVH